VNDYSEELAQVFTDVLEQLAFMFVDEPDSDGPEEPADLAVATMSFNGPFSGQLSLVVPRAMAPTLAANVLGLDLEDGSITQAPYDALKELLNVTCGNLLTAIAGDEPVFDLTVPEIEERPADDWSELSERPNTIHRVVEDFSVLLSLVIEDDATQGA
jgi:chemotaxis protein CheY-P-specific phosphatase CheC